MQILVPGRIATLVFMLAVLVLVLYYIRRGMMGKLPNIRDIAGVSAIREAVGRATEMGLPVHSAVGDVADLKGAYVAQVLAGLTVMSETAKLSARYDTPFIATIGGTGGAGSELVPLIEQLVENAYRSEGKLESFKPENIRMVSGERIAWALGVIGIFYNEGLGANIMVGPWAGTWLPVSEVAARLGAIQIGGTAREAMMPIMACICDYFLIGEDIFAAAALLSKNPGITSSIVVEDLVKVALMGLIVVGVVLLAAGLPIIKTLLLT